MQMFPYYSNYVQLTVLFFKFVDVKDIASFASVRQQIESVISDTGLNLIINNAGIMFRDSLDEVSKETMMENFEVNVVSPLLLVKVSLVCSIYVLIYKTNHIQHGRPL